MWNGSLTFGLINIPIRVYAASEERAIQFHMLHKKDLSPIRFKRVSQQDEKEVPYSEIVKGYEYSKGEYVVVDEDEFKKANQKRTSTMEIQHFAEVSEIDIIFFEKPYYLEPDKKAGKAYRLLVEALKKSQKVAIVNYVFHNKEHLGAIFSENDILMLVQMRYHAEIRSASSLTIPEEQISPKELKMALDLVDQLTAPFEAEKYRDLYADELLNLIDKKLKGKKLPTRSDEIKPSHKAQDLMELLQASMKDSAKPKKETVKSDKTKTKIHKLYSETKSKSAKKAKEAQ
ncbi:MAG: Ku protein [Parachlamydiaceae bacterium]|nr:Ku protein [Parachlamydiaceae bacterium]